ncbi:MAG: polynucleotide adenylyltransferase PcnB [Cellvibrionaceae bacterium]|nr:polynucleotide adenylyltransferase PcnB [Cellvibrionaceae bacterium]
MLKWLSDALSQKLPIASNTNKVDVIAPADHGISSESVSPSAVKVMRRLNQAGYTAYLVGGGVRDLLLETSPKDFDIATDATPEDVRTLFRNSRIIGRRFKIVHVRFGRDIIEVTTFRGQDNDSTQQIESDTGQLLRDNVYGDMRSDALRRDFTANALYYAIEDQCLYDYAQGIQDIARRQLRIIGDPATRYKEDPVRMLRAARFAAKLGFEIEPKTAAPIAAQATLLNHVPPARLFEEVLKLFLNGYATASYEQLNHYGLFAQLFPDSAAALPEHPLGKRLIETMMVNTDKRIRADKRVTPAFIYAAILWPALQAEMAQCQARHTTNDNTQQTTANTNPLEVYNQAAQQVINRQLQRVLIPKRFLIPMRQIWELQFRLDNRYGKRAYRLLEHPKFRAAYDFLLLRETAGEALDNLGLWWTQFQDANSADQETMVTQLRKNTARKKPRRRRRTKPKSQPPTNTDTPSE